ncbi:hypothetical protein HFO28_02320 [Rhizobium leguminosarum]|uniref:hypothetical protein n=1 Tax=Rhizobium leguminosarum TaxID=384 RepID=UPI001C94E638|nr:hypothetical protein [Rhizobium leguminosarum]MBY5742441.1 hypothetical protein [Rhizobium leguminosarum]
MYIAQKVEFALYGLGSHLPADHNAKTHRAFKNLTPEAFLRGDRSKLKATFGVLAQTFGKAFFIDTPELTKFYEDRNLIAHNYYREFCANISGAQGRGDPIDFLDDFIKRGQHWIAVMKGLARLLIEAAAAKEGRLNELSYSEQDESEIEKYVETLTKSIGVTPAYSGALDPGSWGNSGTTGLNGPFKSTS